MSRESQSPFAEVQPIKSAYVHIPFCSYKCDFCDFAAFAGLNHREKEYFDSLSQEIAARLESVKSPVSLTSIYFGGGTPGMVPTHYLAEVLAQLEHSVEDKRTLEICLETTPHSICKNKEKLDEWRGLGVSRLSIGIESFNDEELRSIGRDHTREQAIEGLELALNSKIPTVSIDFMYGLPTQTLSSWEATLDEALDYARRFEKLRHISAYGLQLAEKSPLYSRYPKDSDSYPDEELFTRMLFLLMEKLTGVGFVHYEVSNFARPGYQCGHNSTYWRNEPYLAFGVGAHRYVDGVRSANWRSFNKYVRDFLTDEYYEPIDSETRIKEAIMLGLRMRTGINLDEFASSYSFRLEEKCELPIKRLVEDGFLCMNESNLSISDKGLPVSNSIIVELI